MFLGPAPPGVGCSKTPYPPLPFVTKHNGPASMTDLPLTLFISSPLCIDLAVGGLLVQVFLTQNQFLSYLKISLDLFYENI